jgi:uncharacterized protein with ACT and thioredoxin-like domain
MMIYAASLRHSWTVIDHYHSLYGSWNGVTDLQHSDPMQRGTYSVIGVHHAYHASIVKYLWNF